VKKNEPKKPGWYSWMEEGFEMEEFWQFMAKTRGTVPPGSFFEEP
jgi:hypothetical protein